MLIGTDGLPQKVEGKQSSGFERLDQAAIKTVARWRFVPGTKNGVPEAMWHLQPVNFVLTHRKYPHGNATRARAPLAAG